MGDDKYIILDYPIPQVIKDIDCWALWKAIPNGDGKPKKEPRTIKGYKAACNRRPVRRFVLNAVTNLP